MTTLVEELSETERAALQKEFQAVQQTGWVVELAHTKDWRAANEAYLKRERTTGRAEMEHLLSALRIDQPPAAEEAADLIAAALALFLARDGTEGLIEREGPASVRVRICNCPTYRRIEAANWAGVTACGSWHRRLGWYDALGVYPRDTVLAESKWGDAACESVIEFDVAPPSSLKL